MKTKLGLLLGLLLAAAFLWWVTQDEEAQFQSFTVVRDDFSTVVEAGGDLRSSNSTFIDVPSVRGMWNYQISQIVPEGSEVDQDTLLVSFDTKQIRDRMTRSQTRLSATEKELEKAVLEEQERVEQFTLDLAEAEVDVAKYRRMLKLPEHLVKRDEIRKNRYDLQHAESRLALAQSRLENQKLRQESRIAALEARIKRFKRFVATSQKSLGQLEVKAPKAGLVVYKDTRRGEKLSVGTSVWEGSSLMEIPDLTAMEVFAVVDEREASRVALGQKVDVRLDAAPERSFEGEVVWLGRIFHPESEEKPSVVFDAVIRINQPDEELMRPGMAAQLTIQISQEQNVLQLPREAVFFDGEGAYVLRPGNRRQEIESGRRSGGMVEILSGLQEGDTVVTPVIVAGEGS